MLWWLLEHHERKSSFLLLLLILIGALLEMLGLGMVVPLVGVMTAPDFAEKNSILQYFHYLMPNTSQHSIVITILAIMVIIYIIKTCFLLGLAWIQSGFTLKLQANLSQRLLRSYLNKPWLLYK